MTSHKDYRLDQLGITSQYEADELERDLNVRFDLFAYNDREVWVQQNAYLDAYARNRAVSDSADVAGVPVSIAQNWEYHNTLGFNRRLEIADLRFSDGLQVLALERVREPNAPAALLIELLRAHIPEKFSSNGHVCDTSKADEQRFFYSQDAKRELEAGHPGLSAIADGTYQPPSRSRSHDDSSYTDTPSADAASNPAHNPSAPSAPSTPNPPTPSPVLGESLPRTGYGGGGEGDTPTRHSREHGNPQDAHPHSFESDHETPFPLPDDDIEPVDPDEVAFFNLPPSEREDTSHPNLSPADTPSVGAGFKPAHDPSASSAPSAVNPPAPKPPARLIASLFQKARPNPNDDHDTFPVKRF